MIENSGNPFKSRYSELFHWIQGETLLTGGAVQYSKVEKYSIVETSQPNTVKRISMDDTEFSVDNAKLFNCIRLIATQAAFDLFLLALACNAKGSPSKYNRDGFLLETHSVQ